MKRSRDEVGPGEAGVENHGRVAVPGQRTQVASRYPALARALDARGGDVSTIHDAATAAVEGKDGGAPVDGAVSARVGAHLGVDLGGVRVHGDPLAREATQAMGARAFAYTVVNFAPEAGAGSSSRPATRPIAPRRIASSAAAIRMSPRC